MSSSTAGLTLDRVQQTMDGVQRNLRNAQDAVGTLCLSTLFEHSDTCLIDLFVVFVPAFFVHSAFLARNFELVSLSESGPDEGADEIFISTIECARLIFNFGCVWADLGRAPADWNALDDSYCFRYKHQNSPTTVYLLKLLRIDQMLMVFAVRKGESNSFTTQVNVSESANQNAPFDLINAASLLAKLEKDVLLPISPVSLAAASPSEPVFVESSPTAQSRLSQPAQPAQPPRVDPLRDLSDPLRIGPVRQPPMYDRPHYGDFDDDLGFMGRGAPSFGGPGFPYARMYICLLVHALIEMYFFILRGPMGGGSLMGPDHPMFGAGPRFGGGHPGMGGGFGPGALRGRGGRGRGVRYDPVHPFGSGEYVSVPYFETLIRYTLKDILVFEWQA
jgi:hypothetical protein